MRSDAEYVEEACRYADGVISGEIKAGKWTIRAAKRFIADLAASKKKSFKFTLDAAAAGRACSFIERMPLTKGEGARLKLKLVLQPWQCFVVVNMFGWLNKKTGRRRFRETYLKIPRKNGKSELAAAIGLYCLAADGEVGAEVFPGATTESQARKVFNAAAEMARKEPNLKKLLGVEIWGGLRNPTAITVTAANSKMQPLIGRPGDGDNPHCYICDEYHEHPTDDQYDTMKTGMVARTQPVVLIITTAGSSIGGPCHRYEDIAKKVLLGVARADDLFVAIWEADETDDWRQDDALIKANPNLGVSVLLEELRKNRADAMRRNKGAIFKAKHLNLWVGAEDSYFDVEAWLRAARDPARIVDLDAMKGRRCWLALDLAQKTDFCALAVWAPRTATPALAAGFDLWVRFWLPEETIDAKPEGHNYKAWAAADPPWIEKTDGAMVDFDHVEDDVFEIWSAVDGVDLAFDPAHAAGIVPRLMARGVPCVEFANTSRNMSDPMMLFDGYIREGIVNHPANPVMDWMVSNTIRRKSKRLDLDYPDRSMPDNKIDGVVATLMAIGRQTFAPTPTESVYEARARRKRESELAAEGGG